MPGKLEAVEPFKLLAIYAYRRLSMVPVAHVRLAENEKPECVFPNSQNGPRAKTDLNSNGSAMDHGRRAGLASNDGWSADTMSKKASLAPRR